MSRPLEAVRTGDPDVDGLLGRLEALAARGVWLFPVRHHSPACAHHARRLIRRLSPAFVLVEGPPELSRLLPLMTSREARPPFAAYCAHEEGGARRAGYYPFAAASPELSAVREGARLGAEVRFVDLGFGVKARDPGPSPKGAKRRLRSLLEEAHLARSAYLAALARKTGCRDQDELWEHLFESRPADEATEAFVRDVAGYCLLARRDHDPALLAADGSLLRERAMTLGVRRAMAEREGDAPIVVVTGGFHTPQLAAWLESGEALEAPPEGASEPVLIRYGFRELDALNGYAAGMPAPAYQDALAEAYAKGASDPQLEAAGAMLVELARAARASAAFGANAADEVAALAHAQRLAHLRGRAAVTRCDVQDALLSTLSKGPADAEGALVRRLMQRVFTGHDVGRVPPEAGAPPIVEDFRARAAALKLEAGAVPREVALSLYQRDTHRAASRFLHALAFLEVPYAAWLAGPDFVAGEGLYRRQEKWRLRWSPDVDGALVEASVYGATVDAAAAGKLEEAARELAEAGYARDASAATGLFVQALAMGADDALDGLASVVQEHLQSDPRLERVVAALVDLVLALEGREPLEGFRVDGVASLAHAAFERTLRGLPELRFVPAAREDAVAAALGSLRQLAASRSLEDLAPRLGEAIAKAGQGRPGDGSPRVQGVLTGLAHGFGRASPGELARRVRGHLLGTGSDAEAKVAFLAGVLETAREVAWRQPEVVDGLHRLFEAWDEPTFMRALPALRLAFSHLTPRELDRVAAAVPGALGGEAKPDGAAPEVDPAIDVSVQEALRTDGLAAWGAS